MHPVCFNIDHLTIHWYGVMMAMGFLAGLAIWTFLGKKEGRNLNYCCDLLFWIMVSSIAGARLAYVFSDLKSFLAEPLTILRVDQGGLIYYGGFIGACLAIVVFARIRGENIRTLLDFVVPAVPLAHAFGRIGCLLNGCCYGTEYDGLFAVRYPAQSYSWKIQVDAGEISRFTLHSLPVHPVQLYEVAFNLVLYLFLVWAYRHRKWNGSIAAFYLLTYPFARFWLEFLRGDERMRYMGLSVAQLVSILLFISGAGLWFWSRRKTKS